jgi:adenine-specific DNA-methyltransferase
MILENLKGAGVQQAHKEDKITFTALTPGPASWSAPKAAIWKARPRSAPPSSSAPTSALCSAPTVAAARKRAMPGLMC